MMIARITAVLALALVLGLGPTGAGDASAADYAAAPHDAGAHHTPPVAACPAADPNYWIVAPVPIELLIGPGVDYEQLAMVPECQALRIILCDYRTGWCFVRYGRYDGWVFDPGRRNILHYVLGH